MGYNSLPFARLTDEEYVQACCGPFFEKRERKLWFRSDILVRNWESCKKIFFILKVEFAINWNTKEDVDDDDDDVTALLFVCLFDSPIANIRNTTTYDIHK